MEKQTVAYIDKLKGHCEVKVSSLKTKLNLATELLNSFSESEQSEFPELEKVVNTISNNLNLFEMKLIIVNIIKEQDVYKEKEQKYKDELNKYMQLLVLEGFDDEKFEYISKLHTEICEIINELRKPFEYKYDVRLKYDKQYKLISALWKGILRNFYDIESKYKNFLGVLNYGETNSKLSGEVIKYVIDNTSLIHLVFSHNYFPKIGSPQNLNRMFRCQFHRPADNPYHRTLDMRVRIHKNYFQCFGCGVEGGPIDYLMMVENIKYDQAIYLLAEIYLIDIPENPYKNEENFEIVNYYRNKLISEEYINFLIDSYNSVKNKGIDEEAMYANLFANIQRVKNGIVDSRFEYKEKVKKFKLDSQEDLERVRLHVKNS